MFVKGPFSCKGETKSLTKPALRFANFLQAKYKEGGDIKNVLFSKPGALLCPILYYMHFCIVCACARVRAFENWFQEHITTQASEYPAHHSRALEPQDKQRSLRCQGHASVVLPWQPGHPLLCGEEHNRYFLSNCWSHY